MEPHDDGSYGCKRWRANVQFSARLPKGEEQERRRVELDDSTKSINELREELERLKSKINKD